MNNAIEKIKNTAKNALANAQVTRVSMRIATVQNLPLPDIATLNACAEETQGLPNPDSHRDLKIAYMQMRALLSRNDTQELGMKWKAFVEIAYNRLNNPLVRAHWERLQEAENTPLIARTTHGILFNAFIDIEKVLCEITFQADFYHTSFIQCDCELHQLPADQTLEKNRLLSGYFNEIVASPIDTDDLETDLALDSSTQEWSLAWLERQRNTERISAEEYSVLFVYITNEGNHETRMGAVKALGKPALGRFHLATQTLGLPPVNLDTNSLVTLDDSHDADIIWFQKMVRQNLITPSWIEAREDEGIFDAREREVLNAAIAFGGENLAEYARDASDKLSINVPSVKYSFSQAIAICKMYFLLQKANVSFLLADESNVVAKLATIEAIADRLTMPIKGLEPLSEKSQRVLIYYYGLYDLLPEPPAHKDPLRGRALIEALAALGEEYKITNDSYIKTRALISLGIIPPRRFERGEKKP